jgi:hypothetical protein
LSRDRELVNAMPLIVGYPCGSGWNWVNQQ